MFFNHTSTEAFAAMLTFSLSRQMFQINIILATLVIVFAINTYTHTDRCPYFDTNNDDVEIREVTFNYCLLSF